MIKEIMLNKKSWAVVGATPNKEKFGYKIWSKLIEHGYETYGINPNYNNIEGIEIYKSLKDIPKKIDVIDMVVPPKIGLNVLEEAKKLAIEYIWFQPGTYNKELMEKVESLGLKPLYNDCILETLIGLENNMI